MSDEADVARVAALRGKDPAEYFAKHLAVSSEPAPSPFYGDMVFRRLHVLETWPPLSVTAVYVPLPQHLHIWRNDQMRQGVIVRAGSVVLQVSRSLGPLREFGQLHRWWKGWRCTVGRLHAGPSRIYAP